MGDDIHVVDDLLPSIEYRNKLKEELPPLLVDGFKLAVFYNPQEVENGSYHYPGLQTHATLHLHPSFKELTERATEEVKSFTGKDVETVRMWGKWVDGKRKYLNYHNHYPCEYSFIYYLNIPRFMRNGTLFKGRGLIKGKENSLVIFPSKLDHSSPIYFWMHDRYVVAGDVVSG